MKHILLVISVLLIAMVIIKMWKNGFTQKEGLESGWNELWSSVPTRTSSNVLSKFFESDMRVALKDTPAVADPTNKKAELTLKDIVIKASSNSAVDSNGEPTNAQLRKVLLNGYRFIELHVYMVSRDEGNTLYVGNPAENEDSTSTQLPLSKALETINDLAFIKKSESTVAYDYTKDPLFIQFMLYPQKNNSHDMLETLYKNYLEPTDGKGLIQNEYWYRTPSGAAITIDRNTQFKSIQRKALFGFNVQNLVQLYSLKNNADYVPVAQRRILLQMCNFKTGGHTWKAYNDYIGLPITKTMSTENGLQTDAKQMNIVLPPTSMANNPNVYDVILKNQIQTVPIFVYLEDEGVDLVQQIHNKTNTSTIPLSTALAIAKTMVE